MSDNNIRRPFVPADFEAPMSFKFGDYYLEAISTDMAVEDWLVLTGNAEAIVKQRGGSGDKQSWPYLYSLEGNYIDLSWLQSCANHHQLFCYVVRNSSDDSYAGCVYIYPIELLYSELSNEFDVDYSMWVTQKVFNSGGYSLIYHSVLDWLVESWPFEIDRIYQRNVLVPEKI